MRLVNVLFSYSQVGVKPFMKMRAFSILFSIFLLIFSTVGFSQTTGNMGKSSLVKWQTDPFDHQVFILNKGQFDGAIPGDEKVLYGVQLGSVFAYFTSKGIIYSYTEFPKESEQERGKDPDKDEMIKPVMHYLGSSWEGNNETVSIEASDELSYYYTYPKGTNSTIKTNIFRKIIYKNIYPGIDVEYYFLKGKDGLKYSIILHPGTDISKIKLKYSGANNLKLNPNGDITFNSEAGQITEHAPVSFYEGEIEHISVSNKLNENIESFIINGNYDKSKTLVIDPWITDPLFSSRDRAYDVDYDNKGNVYAYGGLNTYQLVKMNSGGSILWIFNTSVSPFSSTFYGDFATDKRTGNCFVGAGTGADAFKINALGNLVASLGPNPNMSELWRMAYNPCEGNIVVAGGGVSSTYQACILDTSLTSYTPVNVLGASDAFHDMCLLAIDPSGKFCYMATAEGNLNSTFNNVVVRLPLPSLFPASYMVSDGYSFQEAGSITYLCPPFTRPFKTNGMNGMAASPNWLYMYDGSKLRRCNKATGIANDSIKITTNQYNWGGLDADHCDNVFVGVKDTIKVYNSSLSLLKTISFTDSSIYDVVLGSNKNLYACGAGFVTELINPIADTITLSITQPTACLSCNGSATASMSCNSGIFSYLWSNSATTQTITGLCAGLYTVSITDSSTCPPSITNTTVNLNNSIGSINSNLSAFNATCSSNGSVNASPTGGTAPYTYLWTPGGETSATVTGLSGGSYTVTVTDANGCKQVSTITITQPAIVVASILSTTSPLCNGGNGSATALAGGGASPYTYAWLPSGGTNITATGITAGSYTLTVTDAKGCSATTSITITQPPLLTVTISSITNLLCHGMGLGDISATAAGGAGFYSYSWSPSGQTSASATFLTAGSYTVTVRDINGCRDTASGTITQPPALTANMGIPVASVCNGSNFSITVTAGGGTLPYTYSWSPSGQTNATATGLAVGSYTVTIKDANHCITTSTITVTLPAALTASISASTNPLCNGSYGSETVTAIGGTKPYTYSWSPGGGTNAIASGITAGSYTITVTDASGCSVSAAATLTQPPLLTASMGSSSNPLCNAGAGSATVAAAGGTGLYTYSWSPNGGTNATAGITAGSYTVTVSDGNGCNANALVTITQPAPLSVTDSVTTSISCNGGNNGSVSAFAIGGVTPYTYSWSTGGTNSFNTGLTAGTYTLTIKDSNGCSSTASATVTQPAILTVITNVIANAGCNGGNNGSVSSSASGGTLPYTYSWTGGGTNSTNTGLSAGIYTITLKDINGCTATASATITQPSQLIASISSPINPLCNGGSGSATAAATGGTKPYTYSWSPSGGTNATATGITAGSYTVAIKDSNGCITTASVNITQPPLLTASIGITIAPVCNAGIGSATVRVIGGTGLYTYSWSPNGGSNAAAAITAGSYTVTVSDSNGCTATASTTITQPALLNVSTSVTANVSCNGESNGSISSSSTGGVLPFTYSWSTGGTNSFNTGLSAGTYTLTVKDSNGCTSTASATVTQPAVLNATTNVIANAGCNGGNNGSVSSSASGGTLPYTYSWTGGGTNSTNTGLSAGNYTVTVKDSNGCSISASVTITQPAPLNISTNIMANVSCNGGNNGSASVTLSGGTLPYTYSWTPRGGQSSTNTDLTAGIYCCTVTDSNGCSQSACITVTQPSILFSISACCDTSIILGKSVQLSVTGAGSYSWSPSSGLSCSTCNNPVASPSFTTTYTVTASNDSGCSAIQMVTVDVICGDIFVPNAFSPNNDGQNDILYVHGACIEQMVFMVFDRWGNKVFETENANNGWDGNHNGTPMNTGTYAWYLKATLLNGASIEKQGNISLVR
jgi:gliding motility-associated-like protein